MPKLVVCILSDYVHDPDDVPSYEDGVRCFYWGAFADSPVPDVRVWAFFDGDVTRDVAASAVRARVGYFRVGHFQAGNPPGINEGVPVATGFCSWFSNSSQETGYG